MKQEWWLSKLSPSLCFFFDKSLYLFFTGYPCQHERFIRTGDDTNTQWINNVTYCAGQNDICISDMIVTIANISLPHPGVVQHMYTDAPLSPQVSTGMITMT